MQIHFWQSFLFSVERNNHQKYICFCRLTQHREIINTEVPTEITWTDRQALLKKTQFVRYIFDVIILDSIEANVERAQNNVEGANLQLGKASRYQVRQG